MSVFALSGGKLEQLDAPPTACCVPGCEAEPAVYAPGSGDERPRNQAPLWAMDKPLAIDTFVIRRGTPGRAWCMAHAIEAGRFNLPCETPRRAVGI